MHFNGKAKRDAIISLLDYDPFSSGKRFCVYIDLCIHPFSWDTIYQKIRRKQRLDYQTWNCLLGALNGLFINLHMQGACTNAVLMSETAMDFVEFIRSDSVGDPWKFMLSMRVYMRRYCILKSLQSVGVDWREVAYNELGALSKPSNRTYHSIFTNKYVRSFLKALVVFKQMRTVVDEDYQVGVNDRHSLTLAQSTSPKSLPYEQLDKLVSILLESLPSWNTSIRAKVCYAISFQHDLHELFEKQMLPSMQRKIGNGADSE